MKERIAQGSIKIFFFLILPSRIFLYYTTLILPEKCPIKYGVISVLYFPAFGLNTERYEVTLRIQCECGKIRTRNNSVFGHFSCSVILIHDALSFFMLYYIQFKKVKILWGPHNPIVRFCIRAKMEVFAIIVKGFYLLTIFAKSSILDVQLSSEYDSILLFKITSSCDDTDVFSICLN